MTFQALRHKYPGKIVIGYPHLRLHGLGSGRVVSWECLGVVDTIDEAREALALFDLDGVTDAVAISTTEEITLTESLAARYFRVYYGLQ